MRRVCLPHAWQGGGGKRHLDLTVAHHTALCQCKQLFAGVVASTMRPSHPHRANARHHSAVQRHTPSHGRQVPQYGFRNTARDSHQTRPLRATATAAAHHTPALSQQSPSRHMSRHPRGRGHSRSVRGAGPLDLSFSPRGTRRPRVEAFTLHGRRHHQPQQQLAPSAGHTFDDMVVTGLSHSAFITSKVRRVLPAAS